MPNIPPWAQEMREIFKGGSVSQFILYGNIYDLIAKNPEQETSPFVPLRDFLVASQLAPFDLVLAYDRSRGIRTLKDENKNFLSFLNTYDSFNKTSFASAPGAITVDPNKPLELIDRLLDYTMRMRSIDESKSPRIGIVIDHAQFLLPRSDPAYVRPDTADSLLRVLEWASNPAIVSAYVATIILAENLADLHPLLTASPHNAKIRIDLPQADQVRSYIEVLTKDIADFNTLCDVDRATLAKKLEGLSLVDIRHLVQRAMKNNQRISMDYLKSVKKSMIEKSAGGYISFVESTRTMDDVAGHDEAKKWLREDAKLMKMGKAQALPMGYLLTGRIGTGKTFLVECFAGECGVPCVELKNFRDRWVGSTESNLEAIFKILHALGQVIVFVDEADQMTGKRDGGGNDSGLSGRIYAMLAREMADTRNRGRIFWIFATSRPDLLEVDLKRQGRLDVHIPLFPPQDNVTRRQWLLAAARKNKVKLTDADIPDLPDDPNLGGNELEGIVVRTNRLYETQVGSAASKSIKDVLSEVLTEFRPMSNTERLEYMDLIGVVECTDSRFLPPRFKDMTLEQISQRLEVLKRRLGYHD